MSLEKDKIVGQRGQGRWRKQWLDDLIQWTVVMLFELLWLSGDCCLKQNNYKLYIKHCSVGYFLNSAYRRFVHEVVYIVE